MEEGLLIAILAGLGGMLGWGFADFFAKKTIDEVGSIVTLTWAHVFGTLILVLVAFYQLFIQGISLSFPTNLMGWGGVLFFGALQAVVYLLAYEGFGKGQLALLNPVFASYAGLAAIVSVLFLGETLTPSLALSLVVIFTGILLLSLDTQSLKHKRINLNRIPGLKEVAMAALLAAFWQLYWDKFVGGADWVVYTLLMYAFMTLTAFVFAKVKKVNLKIPKKSLWKFLVLIGLGEVVAYLALTLGFSATPYTSIVIVLSGAFSLPTILLARLFLKEKVSTIQTIGSLVIIAGVVILSLMSS